MDWYFLIALALYATTQFCSNYFDFLLGIPVFMPLDIACLISNSCMHSPILEALSCILADLSDTVDSLCCKYTMIVILCWPTYVRFGMYMYRIMSPLGSSCTHVCGRARSCPQSQNVAYVKLGVRIWSRSWMS